MNKYWKAVRYKCHHFHFSKTVYLLIACILKMEPSGNIHFYVVLVLCHLSYNHLPYKSFVSLE